jgi:hypothetical protein
MQWNDGVAICMHILHIQFLVNLLGRRAFLGGFDLLIRNAGKRQRSRKRTMAEKLSKSA